MPPSSNPREPAGLSKAGLAVELGRNGVSDFQVRCREALLLWLRWNEAYERVTAEMFRTDDSVQELESLMDQMDQCRRAAIALSHELLNK